METTTVPLDQLLRPDSVSEGIGVPETTLAQWRYLGTGPAYIKVGKHVRYRRSDLEAWLDSQTRNAGGS